jgi:hypothetical protein
MNHAADDPPPPFTCQKAALLITKIAAKSRLLPLPGQASSGGGYPAADEGAGRAKGRGLEHEELRTTTKDKDFLTSSLKRQETLFPSPLPTCTSSSCYK